MEKDQKTLELISALSLERLNQFIIWADQDMKIALDLYSLNHTVSRALLTKLHTLEIVLRNSVNEKLRSVWGENWFLRENITERKLQEKKVKQVISRIYKETNSEITNFKVISNLSFGFWTMLFSPKNNLLWGEYLHEVFESEQPIQRKNISKSLNDLRILRNRIAHYETIIHMNLQSLYDDCRYLIEMISPIALEWSDSLCNFHEIHPGIPIILSDRVNPELDLNPFCFEKTDKFELNP